MVWAPGWKEKAIRQVLFKCGRCGRCCGEPEIIDLYPEDLNRLSRHFHKNLAQVMVAVCAEHPRGGRRYMMNKSKPCQFYKNGCRIYGSRPIVCRMYPYLAGPMRLCELDVGEVPEMDDQALLIALVKSTGLSVTEMLRYLRYIGAWVD
jgi:Fe-S-cluster containining protein